MSSAPRVQGVFVNSTKGPIFLLARMPLGEPRGCVLVVPPFAEEMNKCRRMVAEMSIRLAEHGWATVIPDLFGTGDSGGDFADADWSTWLVDLYAAANWAQEAALRVNALLAVRLGAALVQHASSAGFLPPVERTVLWQPVFDARRFLSQFLRLRVAASMTKQQRESLADIRARLAAEGRLEIAGYMLGRTLAQQLESMEPPARLDQHLGTVAWMEVGPGAESVLPAQSVELIEATRRAGAVVNAGCHSGEPFWTSTEIVVNREIVRRTLLQLVADAGE